MAASGETRRVLEQGASDATQQHWLDVIRAYHSEFGGAALGKALAEDDGLHVRRFALLQAMADDLGPDSQLGRYMAATDGVRADFSDAVQLALSDRKA